MADVTLTYGHPTTSAAQVALASVDVTGWNMRPDPSDDGPRHATITTITGTGLLSTTPATVRTEMEKAKRIFAQRGGRVQLLLGSDILVDHASLDYGDAGGGTTVDYADGPRITAQFDRMLGGRTVLVRWTLEYRYLDNSEIGPVTGFQCVLNFDYNPEGFLTLTRTGVLTVRRSAGFPDRNSSTAPVVAAFMPTSQTALGGWQTPASAGVSSLAIGNNPDLYRRFVAGTLNRKFRRESQAYYVDASLQRLFFQVVDIELAEALPDGVVVARVESENERDWQSDMGTKRFSAELYGKAGVPKTTLLRHAVRMCQNRIAFSTVTGTAGLPDILTRISVREIDAYHRNGIVFECQAMASSRIGPLIPANFANWAPLSTGAEIGSDASAADAYGNSRLARFTDLYYDMDPPNTPTGGGHSLLGLVQPGAPIVAVIVSDEQADEMVRDIVPAGDAQSEFAGGQKELVRSHSVMTLRVTTGLEEVPAAAVDGAAEAYQLHPPRAEVVEEITAFSVKSEPVASFTPLPWPAIVGKIDSCVLGGKTDANGNRIYGGRFVRRSTVRSDFTNALVTTLRLDSGTVRWFSPASIPEPRNPTLAKSDQPLAVATSGPSASNEESGDTLV